MSGRFQLDPRAPAPERPLPPPPGPASAKPPVPRPSPPSPSPPPSARAPSLPAAAPAKKTNRKLLLIGAVVLALLLVGGAVAVYVATSLGYPDKYTLTRSAMPSGMSNAQLSASERDDLGIRSNPGEMDRQSLTEEVPTSDEPERGHAQILETGSGERIGIFVLQYADEDTAKSAAAELRALCSFANGVVMRDGDVVVVIYPENGATRSQVRAVGNAILNKADMTKVCGL